MIHEGPAAAPPRVRAGARRRGGAAVRAARGPPVTYLTMKLV